MSASHPVLDAFLAGDAAAVVGLLAPAATFHSPVADYEGPDGIAPVLTALAQVLREPAPVSVLGSGTEIACFFTATVAERPGDGMLRIVGEPVIELTLMIRPLETLIAGVKAMERALGGGADPA